MWRRLMGLLRFGMESGAVEQVSRITKVVGRNSIIHGRDLNAVPAYGTRIVQAESGSDSDSESRHTAYV